MVINRKTGDTVRFVNSVFGKLGRHRDYDPRIIGKLGELFDIDEERRQHKNTGIGDSVIIKEANLN